MNGHDHTGADVGLSLGGGYQNSGSAFSGVLGRVPATRGFLHGSGEQPRPRRVEPIGPSKGRNSPDAREQWKKNDIAGERDISSILDGAAEECLVKKRNLLRIAMKEGERGTAS